MNRATPPGVRRYRSRRNYGLEVDAIQVDAGDYDGMCAIAHWCGGYAVGEEDNLPYWAAGAVIAVATDDDVQYARPGDWIAHRSELDLFFTIPAAAMDKYVQVCDPDDIVPRGGWKLSRPCYDKSHRCPGSNGGAMKYARVQQCRGGYITFGMSYGEMAGMSGERWDRYPRPFALGRCTLCDVRVLPFWTRKLSVLWWWDRFQRSIANAWYDRR